LAVDTTGVNELDPGADMAPIIADGDGVIRARSRT
jgi:hypothetical protein